MNKVVDIEHLNPFTVYLHYGMIIVKHSAHIKHIQNKTVNGHPKTHHQRVYFVISRSVCKIARPLLVRRQISRQSVRGRDCAQ